jgi:glycosyltransferase involved in cell wall biosynthesis
MGQVLNELGFDVHIITSLEKAPFVSPRHNVDIISIRASQHPLFFKLSFLAKSLIYVLRTVDRRSIIIVAPAALITASLLRLFGFKNIHLDIRTIPVKVTGLKRSLDKWFFWDFSLRAFSRFASSYSFITERLRAESERTTGLSFSDYCIWSSGVSAKVFQSKRFAHQRNPNDSRFAIFYHGSVSRERGVFEVLHAVELLFGKVDFELSLTIVGSGSDYEELDMLVQQSPAAGIVTLTGFVPYEVVPGLISNADCCICPLPSLPEWEVSSPLKLFEYMAMEKPIIATRIPAHLDILEGQGFVIWTEGTKAADIAYSIKRAYAEQCSLNKAAKNAPLLIKEKYDWTILGGKFGAFLHEKYGNA